MLTDRSIRSLKAPAIGQRDVSDAADVKGLILRVSQRSKIFYLSFRSPGDGKPAKIRIGEYPAVALATAREQGRAYRTLIEQGVDPREHVKAEAARLIRAAEAERALAERKAGNTLGRAINDFVAYCQKAGQRRWRERERQLRRYLPAQWSDRQLDEIGRAECKELLERIEAESGAIQANRVMQTLRALYNWVIREGRCERNPAAKLRSAIREVSRDRVLSDAELAAVWMAASELGEPFGPYVRLLVLCGQRRTETATARWRDIDLGSAVWEIPAAQNKQGRVHRVPLSTQAVELLRSISRFTDDPGASVFSTTMGAKPVSGLSKVKTRLDKLISEAAAKGRAVPVADWVFHDLRRTVASGMARLGVPPHVCEKVLGHEEEIRGIAKVYNRFDYGDEKRRALEAWAEHVMVITDTTGKVFSLARRA